MIIEILIGIIVVLILFSGIILIDRNKIKVQSYFHRNEIINLKKEIKMWTEKAIESAEEVVEQREEIKNLHLENDSINEQKNIDKNTYVLEHNQIEKIRKILEG